MAKQNRNLSENTRAQIKVGLRRAPRQNNPSGRKISQKARSRLQSVANSAQAKRAVEVLDQLELALDGEIPNNLPQVHLAEVESTSTILIEWIFPGCRLVFNIELDESVSGWGYASKSGEGIWGKMEEVDYSTLVKKSLECAVSNGRIP